MWWKLYYTKYNDKNTETTHSKCENYKGVEIELAKIIRDPFKSKWIDKITSKRRLNISLSLITIWLYVTRV